MLMVIKFIVSDINGCKDRCDLWGLFFIYGFVFFVRWFVGLLYFIFVMVLNFFVLEFGNV